MAQRIVLMIYILGMAPLFALTVANEFLEKKKHIIKRITYRLFITSIWPFLIITARGRTELSNIIINQSKGKTDGK